MIDLMRPFGWVIALEICLASALARGSEAQSKAPTSTRSTMSGVYTAEQANRGRRVYAGSCRSCHTPESHTGQTFRKWWAGHPLSDLFEFISVRMPKNDPGSLADEDVADVTAYLLSMNRMSVGKSELPADPDSLKKIRIVTRTKGTKP